MKKIPFNISYKQDIIDCKLGIKVETRGGLPVKIISWEATEREPIAAVIDHDAFLYRESGIYDDTMTSDLDLYLVLPFEPKFKIGDKIKNKFDNRVSVIKKIENGFY